MWHVWEGQNTRKHRTGNRKKDVKIYMLLLKQLALCNTHNMHNNDVLSQGQPTNIAAFKEEMMGEGKN